MCLGLFGSLLLPLFSESIDSSGESVVFVVELSLFSSGVLWNEHRCDNCVEFIEENIGEDRACY